MRLQAFGGLGHHENSTRVLQELQKGSTKVAMVARVPLKDVQLLLSECYYPSVPDLWVRLTIKSPSPPAVAQRLWLPLQLQHEHDLVNRIRKTPTYETASRPRCVENKSRGILIDGGHPILTQTQFTL